MVEIRGLRGPPNEVFHCPLAKSIGCVYPPMVKRNASRTNWMTIVNILLIYGSCALVGYQVKANLSSLALLQKGERGPKNSISMIAEIPSNKYRRGTIELTNWIFLLIALGGWLYTMGSTMISCSWLLSKNRFLWFVLKSKYFFDYTKE